MDLGNRRITARHPDQMRLMQHIRMGMSEGRLEPVGGQFDQKPHRIAEIDRIHETAVLGPGMGDAAFVQPRDGLRETGARHREGKVMDIARTGPARARIGQAVLVGEDGDQAAVAGVEVKMPLGRVVEIGLLENEGHAQQPLPEVDRDLPTGPGQGNVMQALALDLSHGISLGPGRASVKPAASRPVTLSRSS
jgi:hypothetical protein